MPTYRVKLSASVRDEIRAITRWYRNNASSLQVAVDWNSGLIETLNKLTTGPYRYSKAYEDRLVDYEIRVLLYGSGKRITHRILYRVVQSDIEILAIRHTSQRNLTAEELP